jgi:hypothetical protein
MKLEDFAVSSAILLPSSFSFSGEKKFGPLLMFRCPIALMSASDFERLVWPEAALDVSHMVASKAAQMPNARVIIRLRSDFQMQIP